MVLEAVAETGVKGEKFSNVFYSINHAETITYKASELLNQLSKTKYIKTSKDILNIIKPNGKFIGVEGASNRIRIVYGNLHEAEAIFKSLVKDGKCIINNSEKQIYKLSDELFITYRSKSISGPPTIDINIRSQKNNIKLKFAE